VHRSLYEKFVSACVEKTRKLRVGDGMDPTADVGPMIHARQLRIVESQVEEAVSRGARGLTGGKRLARLGPNYYEPTVLVGVNHSMRIMREETFGPVLPIMQFDDDDEAVAMANDSEFGLSASIWTGSRRRGEALARRLEAGTVMINDVLTCFAVSEAPHGGVKASGIGRTHGLMGLEEMVRSKYIDSDLVPRTRKGWWYGYGPEFASQMAGLADFLFSPRLGRRIAGALRSMPALWRTRL
jgi:acyl-CoA reductase-like NAD-dependent aldehyde dehydrogenase